MERRDGKSQHHPKPDITQKLEMQQIIWDRRKSNIPFDVIGEELGISGKTAWKYFHEYHKHLIPPNVEQERLLHVHQLQDMMHRLQLMLDRYQDWEQQLKI